MSKVVLITGSTDGIGLETAKDLVEKGHTVLLHGRSADKLSHVKAQLLAMNENAQVDLSKPTFRALLTSISLSHKSLKSNQQFIR